MSATCASFAAGWPHASFVVHALRRVEPGVAAIGFRRAPVRRHPARPAELTELAEADGLDRARWDGQLRIPIELGAVVEIDEGRQRLAHSVAGQKSPGLRRAVGGYGDS